MQPDDRKYMARCLELARLGEYYVAPNPMVGAVLVDANGHIVGEGWHRQFGGPHAEPNCLEDFYTRYNRPQEQAETPYSPLCPPPSSLTLYVSLEPCSHYGKTPPCADLIVRKGIGRVVIGCLDPNPKVSGRGVQILREAGIEVEHGVMEEECRWLNRRFLTLQEKKRPYVILKWAQTADGFMDYKRTDGEPLQISTAVTKTLVHRLRAENMAIMVGSGTALLDNPHLTTKHWPGRNPIRVLLDRRGRVPADARIFADTTAQYALPAIDKPYIVYREPMKWEEILADLARRGIHSLIVEGGAELFGTIFASGIYDEVHIETAPFSIGNGVKAPRMTDYPDKKMRKHTEYEEDNILNTYVSDDVPGMGSWTE